MFGWKKRDSIFLCHKHTINHSYAVCVTNFRFCSITTNWFCYYDELFSDRNFVQELFPGKVGTMAGLTVGFAFGMGAVGSVALGAIADSIGIIMMIKLVNLLPILGILACCLPSDKKIKTWYQD